MRNKNKTALMAEEIFNEIYEENKETLKFFDKRTLALGFVKGFNAASLQTQEKDKEIAELKEARDEREELIKAFDAIRMEFEGRKWLMEGRGNYRYDDEKYKEEVRYIMDAFNEINGNLWRKIKSKTFEYRNAIESPLKSTIESQQKEIEELKTSIEGVFGWREKNHHLTISEKQLKSQLSEVTKERDRIKGGYLKVLTMLNEILTPTKE